MVTFSTFEMELILTELVAGLGYKKKLELENSETSKVADSELFHVICTVISEDN